MSFNCKLFALNGFWWLSLREQYFFLNNPAISIWVACLSWLHCAGKNFLTMLPSAQHVNCITEILFLITSVQQYRFCYTVFTHMNPHFLTMTSETDLWPSATFVMMHFKEMYCHKYLHPKDACAPVPKLQEKTSKVLIHLFLLLDTIKAQPVILKSCGLHLLYLPVAPPSCNAIYVFCEKHNAFIMKPCNKILSEFIHRLQSVHRWFAFRLVGRLLVLQLPNRPLISGFPVTVFDCESKQAISHKSSFISGFCLFIIIIHNTYNAFYALLWFHNRDNPEWRLQELVPKWVIVR